MQSTKTVNTKPSQYEMLVEYLEKHRDLSKGYLKNSEARQKSNQMWTKLAENLNAEGPPQRDAKGWKKVWSDFKNNVKGKLRTNKVNLSGTGGGPSKQKLLTPLESKVAEILDLTTAVEGMSNVACFGVSTITSHQDDIEILDIQHDGDIYDSMVADIENEIVEENSSNLCNTSQRRTQSKKRHETLLERQVENQIVFQNNSNDLLKNINENLNGILKYTKRQNETSEKMYKLKKQKLELKKEIFEFKKKSNIEKTKIRIAKLQAKDEILKLRQRM